MRRFVSVTVAAGLAVGLLGVVAVPASAADAVLSSDEINVLVVRANAASNGVDHRTSSVLENEGVKFPNATTEYDADARWNRVRAFVTYGFGTGSARLDNVQPTDGEFFNRLSSDCLTAKWDIPEQEYRRLQPSKPAAQWGEICDEFTSQIVLGMYLPSRQVANMLIDASKTGTVSATEFGSRYTIVGPTTGKFVLDVNADGTIRQYVIGYDALRPAATGWTVTYSYGSPVGVMVPSGPSVWDNATGDAFVAALQTNQKIIEALVGERVRFEKSRAKKWAPKTVAKRVKDKVATFGSGVSVKATRKTVVVVFRNQFTDDGTLKYTLRKSGRTLKWRVS